MTAIPTIVVTPSAAADAYTRNASDLSGSASASPPSNFPDTVKQFLQNAIATGENAEAQSTQALSGGGNLTEVVTALSRAEMTLQTASAIRDRVIQAYQDIMKMPI
jgi:flagellar hook-basal body complex protein FliE